MSVQKVSINSIITTEQAARFAPVVTFHLHEQFFPCAIDWLLERAALRSRDEPDFLVHHPQQRDLASYWEDDYYLSVEKAAHPGQPLQGKMVAAPMYTCAQEWDDCIEITYLMLYGCQRGLENISVLVSKDYHKLLGVGFSAYGKLVYHPARDCQLEGTHAMVRVALNGPATVDLLTDIGPVWAPHRDPATMLSIVGLDEGNPISDQRWVRFQGRLGKHEGPGARDCVNGLRRQGLRLSLVQPRPQPEPMPGWPAFAGRTLHPANPLCHPSSV